jgi:hypothetical protein
MSIGSTSVPAVTLGLAAAIACAPATAALAQGSRTQTTANATKQIDGQRQFTPGRLVVPVTGTLASAAAPSAEAAQERAAGAVTGSFAIQRFARTTEDAVAAVGTLTLTFTDQTTSASRTIVTQAALPLTRSTEIATPAPSGEPAAPATRACETLRLVLGSIEVAPLGVAVQIDRVNVDVTALPGLGERLSGLLCEVTSQITGTARPVDLVNTLNALLDLLG